MKDKENLQEQICTKCGRPYTERPAMSRIDGSPICPDCGTREALESIGVKQKEQDEILEIIHQTAEEYRRD